LAVLNQFLDYRRRGVHQLGRLGRSHLVPPFPKSILSFRVFIPIEYNKTRRSAIIFGKLIMEINKRKGHQFGGPGNQKFIIALIARVQMMPCNL
jgi:hypothetical protein